MGPEEGGERGEEGVERFPNMFPKLGSSRVLLRRIDKSPNDAGRDIIEELDSDLGVDEIRPERCSLAFLTASSAPNNPGMSESIFALAEPIACSRVVHEG